PLGTPPGGMPSAVPAAMPAAPPTVAVPAPARGRRTGLIALAVAVVLAGGALAAVQWLPGGSGSGSGKGKGSGASQAQGSTPAPSGAATAAGSAGTTGGSRGAGGSAGSGDDGPAAAAPEGSLISPAGARAAIEAFRKETGTTTFLNLRLYEGYVLADIPVTPGAKATNSYRYDKGKASRFGASGLPVQQGKPPIDMTKIDWDALPALMDRSQRDLGIGHPSMRYVVVEPWLMDGSPSLRPYLTDETGNGGYVHAGIDGKVVKVYRS
ncbi:hypothetical protein LG632_13035, partial [Streptomyces sp. SMC 277]|nr:hypothetical protein [Streptomyces antimicrobicus]